MNLLVAQGLKTSIATTIHGQTFEEFDQEMHQILQSM